MNTLYKCYSLKLSKTIALFENNTLLMTIVHEQYPIVLKINNDYYSNYYSIFTAHLCFHQLSRDYHSHHSLLQRDYHSHHSLLHHSHHSLQSLDHQAHWFPGS